MTNSGRITIRRTSQEVNRHVKIRLFIDGQKLMDLADGETKSADLVAGDHILYAKIDWCRSRDLSFSIHPGEEQQVELGSPVKLKNNPLYIMADWLIILGCIAFRHYEQFQKIFLFLFGAWLIWKIRHYYISKSKPLLYYLLFKRKDYLYLKLIK